MGEGDNWSQFTLCSPLSIFLLDTNIEKAFNVCNFIIFFSIAFNFLSSKSIWINPSLKIIIITWIQKYCHIYKTGSEMNRGFLLYTFWIRGCLSNGIETYLFFIIYRWDCEIFRIWHFCIFLKIIETFYCLRLLEIWNIHYIQNQKYLYRCSMKIVFLDSTPSNQTTIMKCFHYIYRLNKKIMIYYIEQVYSIER